MVLRRLFRRLHFRRREEILHAPNANDVEPPVLPKIAWSLPRAPRDIFAHGGHRRQQRALHHPLLRLAGGASRALGRTAGCEATALQHAHARTHSCRRQLFTDGRRTPLWTAIQVQAGDIAPTYLSLHAWPAASVGTSHSQVRRATVLLQSPRACKRHRRRILVPDAASVKVRGRIRNRE